MILYLACRFYGWLWGIPMPTINNVVLACVITDLGSAALLTMELVNIRDLRR